MRQLVRLVRLNHNLVAAIPRAMERELDYHAGDYVLLTRGDHRSILIELVEVTRDGTGTLRPRPAQPHRPTK